MPLLERLFEVLDYHQQLQIIAKFSDHVKIRFISQLINGMSSALQKLLKFFNDTTISTSFFLLLPSNFPVILAL